MNLSALVGAGLVLVAGTAVAQPKPPAPARACGVTAIPLAVGSEWVYEPVAPPADRALTDAQKRLTPLEPRKLTIAVTAIDTKDGVTTVSLRESLDQRTHTTSIKCTGGGATFQVAPDAFWFAGEPGPSYGIELSHIERKGQTLSLAGGKIAGLEWRDDLSAAWKHIPTAAAKPTMRGGKLQVTRRWVAQPDEEVNSPVSGTVTAKKLGVEITNRVTIEPAPPQPIKDSPLMVNFFWYVDGIGPVQVLNSYGQMFVLTSIKQ